MRCNGLFQAISVGQTKPCPPLNKTKGKMKETDEVGRKITGVLYFTLIISMFYLQHSFPSISFPLILHLHVNRKFRVNTSQQRQPTDY